MKSIGVFSPAVNVNSAAVLSSIPLQMIYNFNIFYYVFYFLATFLMVIYKSQVFSFPDGNLALDLILLILMVILEVIRLYHGFKGNLTEEVVPIVINLVLTIGSMLLSLYYLLWQTYVLKADVIINAILLAIYGLEEVLDVIAVSTFARIYT
ncbi:transmembrane protein 80-like isoform X1 [Pristis pectinata]|uniref:transmembrane protein 80-like isoform X1 n=2 Tax=Pristis pectinata TaxID=685728 RepID=UPI00223CF85F|nr:transmembrane protein 80-like isoform X1 [Pristis pectinata]